MKEEEEKNEVEESEEVEWKEIYPWKFREKDEKNKNESDKW